MHAENRISYQSTWFRELSRLKIAGGTRIWLAAGVTDMRKGFDGLCGLVHAEIGRRPVSGEVFIFVNHQRDKINCLTCSQEDLCFII